MRMKGRLAAAMMCGVLVIAGCGSTGRNEEDSSKAAAAAPAPANEPQAQSEAPSGDAPAPAPEAVPGQTTVESPTATGPGTSHLPLGAGAGSVGDRTAPKTAAGQQSPSAGQMTSTTRDTAPAEATPRAPSAPTPGQPGVPQPSGSDPKKEVVFGSVGTQSGVLGQILGPTLQGAQAWVADINSRGGLNGHPVRLVTADDGADPGRALALAKRMVEQDRAIALVADIMPVTLQAVTPYLEQKQVPLLGGCSCSSFAGESPMVFYAGVYPAEGVVWAHIGPLVSFSDKRKVSLIYCREVPACPYVRDGLHRDGAKSGIQIVHEAQASLAQPDYTAEVLAARNAGAEAVIMVMDNFSVIRIARAAHRQGYNPLFVAQYASQDERFLKDGGSDIDGLLLAGQMPHWDSPKLAEYKAKLKQWVPNAPLSGMSAAVWTMLKMMEKAAPGFSANPTSADILKGLYSLNGETMGGLLPPTTYIEGKRHGDTNPCIVPLRVQSGKFIAVNGDNWSCPPGWVPLKK